MGVFTTTDAGELYDSILAKIQNDIGEILYPGDERRIFAEAVIAWTVITYNTIDDTAKQVMLRWARNEVLEAIGEGVACDRIEAQKAKTIIKYSMNSDAPQDVVIPKGSRVATEEGDNFETAEEITISAGDLEGTVEAYAVEGGASYNGFLPGSINSMVDLIAYIDAVENTTESAGGTDAEGDESYRERIRLALTKFSTAGPKDAYKYWALTADERVADADVTSPAPNEINVYFVMRDGTLPDEDLIQKVYDTVTAEDVKPLGDLVTVSAPTASEYDIELKYYVTGANETEAVKAIEQTSYEIDGVTRTGAVETYRLWQDTVIGRDINPDKLKALVMNPAGDGSVAGADRVEITSPTFTQLSSGVVGHFSGNITITHEVVEDV